ncbi:MAG: two-component sensor histidine kinase, partial [Proteobacteria bacterium]|nr:two-component sensor histidine kinase [Pseudomonadota bacterium]
MELKNTKFPGTIRPEGHYRRLLFTAIVATSLVSVFPIVIMTVVNYLQYQEAFHKESIRPVSRLTTNAKLSLKAFLSERLSALNLVVHIEKPEVLADPVQLKRNLRHMQDTFGGFIDLGLISEDGQQISYAGPYQLEGLDYQNQDWFNEVNLRGTHISEVFMGHRNVPHFVIAVKHRHSDEKSIVLRATIDTEAINRQILSMGTQGDAFIINKKGILQTPSRLYGNVLQEIPISVPPYSQNTELIETFDENGSPLIVGYAYVDRTPFAIMLLNRPGAMQENWVTLRRSLVLFLIISVVFILVVVVWGSKYMVNRAREADLKQAAFIHNLEYTNKMAAIGRLAAGVAHEINNPLAIINEKAGLLKDRLELSKTIPPKEKQLKSIDSIIKSVDRCGTITHRLLGFAKHMDLRHEPIHLDILVKEVLGFLEREATYRSIKIGFDVEPDLPAIESDRGQLQQVFLNIINNGMMAVPDGGEIEIKISKSGFSRISVSITDNGTGIPEENL